MKLLFISHVASRSGAPMLLLSLIRWIKEHTDWKVSVLLLQDGPLRKDFEKVADTFAVSDVLKSKGLVYRVKRKISPSTFEEEVTKVVTQLMAANYDLVYGNTILSLPWLLKFKALTGKPAAAAIHELSFVLEVFFKKAYLQTELNKLDRIFAGSQAVADNLIQNFGTDPRKTETVHSFIDILNLPTQSQIEVRQSLGIKSGDFVIGGAGTLEWRKGTDQIVPLLTRLQQEYPTVPVKFIWVGGKSSDNAFREIMFDAKASGVEEHLIQVEASEKYLEQINAMDVFVLLSREDPFPLVMLEAALLQKPLLAFEQGGGAKEIISHGAGYMIPYLSVSYLAEKINYLYSHPDIRREQGMQGKHEVETKYRGEVIAPRIVGYINGLLSEKSAG